jgi:peptide/nickel transport system permease protein
MSAPVVTAPFDSRRRRHVATELRAIVRSQPLATVGAIALLCLLVVAVIPSVFATHSPTAQNIAERLSPPGSAHWFGTDELGRDLYSRVVHGTGLTLAAAFGVVALSTVIGTALGLLAGQGSGVVDASVMRLSDIFLSFPSLIMALAFVSFFGPSLVTAMLALSLVWWPQYARLVRGQVLSIREHLYIESARSTGATEARILFVHVLPNCVVPIIVKASLDFSYAILITASLSFLGVGAQPPSSELGALVASGRVYLLTAWWLTTFPSLVIFVAVLSLNLVSDAIRDLLDPTLRIG